MFETNKDFLSFYPNTQLSTPSCKWGSISSFAIVTRHHKSEEFGVVYVEP